MNRFVLVTGVMWLAGCRVGPDYRRPETAAPAAWAEGSSEAERVSAQSSELVRWWTVFGDPRLDSLVERAVAANLDLAGAAARVREARALAGRARAERLPEVDAVGSATHGRVSENGILPVVGDPEGDSYRAGFDASWELDLFGGRRRALEAAEAEMEASIEDRRAVLVSLVGEVARAYVELRASQRLASVARQNADSARQTLELSRTRQSGGLGTELDVARAEALLAGAEAPLPGYETSARIAMHRLAVLLGAAPGELLAELEPEAPIPAPPARILLGLPSELLERRPDVRRAERRLAAATARVGVAEAERYPKVSLTGAFGFESTDGVDFAQAASRAWSLGPAVRWPIFSGGRLRADVEVQDARVEQADLAYRQVFLTALEEVENALVGYLREWDHRRALESSVEAGRKSVSLADSLYRRGLTSFLDVLDAERGLYESELRLAESEAASSLNVVSLYKALGGGWQTEG